MLDEEQLKHDDQAVGWWAFPPTSLKTAPSLPAQMCRELDFKDTAVHKDSSHFWLIS